MSTEHVELCREVAKLLGGDVHVDVTEWVGCDEDSWTDPVYVTARRRVSKTSVEGGGTISEWKEYFDAICDLGWEPGHGVTWADFVKAQAEFVVEQLEKG